MRFSIVAPNWNEMPYLEDMFFKSLCNQSFKNFEVIIVDGGSNDRSTECILEYSEKLKVLAWMDSIHNIGYIRNQGASQAKGDIIIQTSTDIEFPHDILERLDKEFRDRPDLIALGGKTIPTGKGASLICRFAYWGFDNLRAYFTSRFMPKRWRKMRPAGNFLAIYKSLFDELKGYPEVKINEDGLFGYRIDDYVKESGLRASFSLDYKVKHNVKRFEKKGGIRGVLFYIYVLANFFPVLNPLLKPIEEKNAELFSTREDLEELNVSK